MELPRTEYCKHLSPNIFYLLLLFASSAYVYAKRRVAKNATNITSSVIMIRKGKRKKYESSVWSCWLVNLHGMCDDHFDRFSYPLIQCAMCLVSFYLVYIHIWWWLHVALRLRFVSARRRDILLHPFLPVRILCCVCHTVWCGFTFTVNVATFSTFNGVFATTTA